MSYELVDWVIENIRPKALGLRPAAKDALIHIAKHVNKVSGEANVGYGRLEELCGYTRPHVIELIVELEDAALLNVTRGAGPRGSNIYRVLGNPGPGISVAGLTSASQLTSVAGLTSAGGTTSKPGGKRLVNPGERLVNPAALKPVLTSKEPENQGTNAREFFQKNGPGPIPWDRQKAFEQFFERYCDVCRNQPMEGEHAHWRWEQDGPKDAASFADLMQGVEGYAASGEKRTRMDGAAYFLIHWRTARNAGVVGPFWDTVWRYRNLPKSKF